MLRPMSIPSYRASHRIPPRAGVGLMNEHAADISANARGVAFFEVHAESYFADGDASDALLSQVRDRFPLSLHGVGLLIGGAKPLDREHLGHLQQLVALYRPGLFSEHLAWSSHGDICSDVQTLPYNEKTIARVASHVDQVQKVLGMRMLLENPNTSVAPDESTMGETEFLSEIVARSGCGLLLDVNNVHASAMTCGFCPFEYLDMYPVAAIGEIHVRGQAVPDAVWALYEHAIERAGPVPTVIEWDDAAPYAALAAAAARADAVIERFCMVNFKQSA